MPVASDKSSNGNMESRKEKDEFSDCEDMETDRRSPTKSDKGGSSDSSMEGSSDEELDEAECDSRKRQCLADMTDLERQFVLLKDQLYKERLDQIDNKLKEIYAGRAPEYLNPLSELQEQMRSRTRVAGMLKNFRLENLQNKYAAEEQSAYQDFQSKKGLLVDQIRESLDEKIRHLDEDRHHLENSDYLWSEMGSRKNEKLKTAEKRKKPVVVTGPYMVYMLSEQDIMEDWNIIRKTLTRKEV